MKFIKTMRRNILHTSPAPDLLLNGEEQGGAARAAAPAAAGTAIDYQGPYVQVGATRLPLADHMPGTYFSKNGRACVCHHTADRYCIESVGNCNCMRYYPTGYAATCEIDLLGAQCFAFARLVFYKCFGFIDHAGINAGRFHSVGSLSRGAATANTVRELLGKANTGAHVRLSAGHSVSILTMDENFLVIYHGNAGGDGVPSSPCVVSTRRYTWAQFADRAAQGIEYVNVPNEYHGPMTGYQISEERWNQLKNIPNAIRPEDI